MPVPVLPYRPSALFSGRYYIMLSVHRYTVICLLLLCAMVSTISAQQHDFIKVMSYNLLNYPDAGGLTADTSSRNPHFRTIMQAADPDIIAVAELNSQAGYLGFLSHVLNTNGSVYSAAAYITSNDSERGLFYKSSKFQFISNTPILTALRDINEFKLVHLLSGDTLRIYVVHLKASTGISNEQQRAAEVDSLRKRTNALPPGSDFIVCGDFNIYGSGESAYQKLLQVQSGVQGHFTDMLSLSGTWNNPAFALYHTQSPRVRSFGGGATGGMDDRFDMILYSASVAQPGGIGVVPNSLLAYGNDGNHYNDSINRLPNTAVSAAVANALHNASDHLPVLLTLDFEYGNPQTLDAGMTVFVQPLSSCPDPAASLKARIKNYGSATLDFSITPVTAVLKMTAPGGQLTTFQQTVTSGALAAGAELLVTFGTTANMSVGGLYSFTGYTTSVSADVNHSNDTLAATSFNVISLQPAAISPTGPIQICNGSSRILTASGGTFYQWSTGASGTSITINAAGTYTVTATGPGGCTSVSAPVVVTLATSGANDTLFYENMGSVSVTTSITAHEAANGFLRDDLTMSGNGDVRITQISSGYAGASGQANVFITNINGRNFQISDINTTGRSNLQLKFAVYKNTSGSTGADFKVQVSADGTTWNDLSFTALPTGSGWYERTASGTIPSTVNLRIRFLNTGTATQYRVDDVLLTAATSVQITNLSSDTICNGQTALLTAPAGSDYLWSTGATTSSIAVNSPGVYTVNVDCNASQPYTIFDCASVNLQLHFLVEGLYTGGGYLRARLYENGFSTQPDACDSVIVRLHQPVAPYAPVYLYEGVFNTSGDMTIPVPQSYIGQSFYLSVRGLSLLETWSKDPVLIQGNTVSFDFATP